MHERLIRGLLIVLIAGPTLEAQTPRQKDTLSHQFWNFLETWLSDANAGNEDPQLLDDILSLREHPVNLRRASLGDLLQLPGMTPLLGLNILDLRTKGRLLGIEDLLQVDGISDELYTLLQYCCTLEAQGLELVPTVNYRARWGRDLQTRRGYLDRRYLGSPDKIYQRLNVHLNFKSPEEALQPEPPFMAVSLGFLTEKDPGEPLLVDHYSGYLQCHLPQYSARVILGDFILASGQGLVFSGSGMRGKSDNVLLTTRVYGSVLRPSLSSNENTSVRGVAIELDDDWWRITGFYSKHLLSASINETGSITSLNTTGLFRTEREREDRKQSGETTIGIQTFILPLEHLRIGISAYHRSFNHPIEQREQFAFHGTHASCGSLDILYVQQNYSIAAELARDKSGTAAAVVGLQWQSRRGAEFLFHLRSYPRDFQSLLGNAPGEHGDELQNEQGVLWGGKITLTHWLTASGYLDHFKFPWKTFSSVMPSTGTEMRLVLDLKPKPSLKIQLQYRQKELEQYAAVSLPGFTGDLGRRESFKQQYRLAVQWEPISGIRWGSRLEVVHFSSPLQREEGFFQYQELQGAVSPWLRMQARVLFFHTDSYDSRFYIYEHDLPGVLSNPMVYGRGMRWYYLAEATIASWAGCSLKFSESVQEGVKSVGTGLSEVPGEKVSHINFQIDMKF